MNKQSWLIALLIAVAFIIVKGYTFNSGDQEEHLPQVYQMINPALYANDYFVTACHQTFTVRFFFVWLIYLFHFIMPVSITCFVLHLLCITIVVWCISRFILHFEVPKLFAFSGAACSVIIFNGFTVGGNSLLDPQLTCAGIATPFCTLAFYYAFKKNWYVAAAMSGMASLFQVLEGLHVMAIICVLFIVTESGKNKIILLLKFSGLYLFIASPMLFPILFLQTQVHTSDQKIFYDILYRVRNPNHYLPSVFPINDYIRFIAITFVAGLMHFFVDGRLKKIWRTLFIVTTSGMLIYFLLLEGINFMPIGKLQWFKVSTWMLVMNVVVISVFLSRFYNPEKLAYPTRINISSPAILVFIIIGVLIITNSFYLPIDRFKYRYHIGNLPQTDLGRMHEWIRTHTPVDCLILTAPDNSSFLCEAQRGMPVGWKAIIHEPFFLIPWYNKFKAAYHDNLPFAGFDVLDQATKYYYKNLPMPSENIRWDYRLCNFEQGNLKTESEIIVHREGNIVLLKPTTK